MPSNDSSIIALLQSLQERFSDVPFIALGQTALWDEPVKAVWRRLLDRHFPEATLIAGVHDTDYFAKTSAHISDQQPYLALPHNDGPTRDLWSAAGELSSLFGSESVPTRQMYLKQNVPFDWLGSRYPGGKSAFYEDQTTAWGWRGIVSTGSHSLIAHDVPLSEFGDALLAQLDWGFAESLACLADAPTRQRAEHTFGELRRWITEFIAGCPGECTLSDLYQSLLPRLYTMLLGETPAHFSVTSSTALFRFNTQTCHLPRFSLLEAFLNPKTREAARSAYSHAVEGSGIYPLDSFGDGALPFDLVIPGVGRGTLRVTSEAAFLETAPRETKICDGCSIESIEELARRIEETFGRDVALVGKAVTLVDMIAAEHMIVFHESASGYTPLTHDFNTALLKAGVSLDLYPIVRLHYHTWDALQSVTETQFQLPPHLAGVFGRETLAASEFGQHWHEVIKAQKQLLAENRALRSPRSVMQFLEGRVPECWCERQDEYDKAVLTLRSLAEKSLTLRGRIDEHWEELRTYQSERLELERRKGEDWRQHLNPLRDQLRQAHLQGRPHDAETLQRAFDRQVAIRANAFDEPIAICRERVRASQFLIREFRKQRRLLERGPEAQAARGIMAEILQEAEQARLEVVRDAFLAIEGLEHTNVRPTAWWLPIVSPDGAWFEAITNSAEARLESLLPEPSA